jgi:hypothetical protein
VAAEVNLTSVVEVLVQEELAVVALVAVPQPERRAASIRAAAEVAAEVAAVG